MKCIHTFYYNDFKNYCLSNHLNPIDELQLRKTELSSIYSNKNISLIPLIIIGLASSLFMSYSLQKLSFLSDTTDVYKRQPTPRSDHNFLSRRPLLFLITSLAAFKIICFER